MQDDKFQVSKTSTCTIAIWVASLCLYLTALFCTDRPMHFLLAGSIIVCGMAAAWTVRCFMRGFMNDLRNAYEVGLDRGRQEATRDASLHRVR